jgi:protein-S-isoprenylcysteine O-methyltransferase Ste14
MTAKDHPDIVAPPPLLYVAALVVVVVLDWLWPMPILGRAAAWSGGAILALGLALNLWGAHSMRRAETPINPYKPTESIVASGAFRISRNPLYLGLNLMFLGLTLILDSLWGIIALILLAVTMHHGVILQEERYLEEKFGEAYRRYREKVRRYL